MVNDGQHGFAGQRRRGAGDRAGGEGKPASPRQIRGPGQFARTEFNTSPPSFTTSRINDKSPAENAHLASRHTRSVPTGTPALQSTAQARLLKLRNSSLFATGSSAMIDGVRR